MYNLRGGFLVRPLTIAVALGAGKAVSFGSWVASRSFSRWSARRDSWN